MKHAWVFSLVALTGFSLSLAQTSDRDMPIVRMKEKRDMKTPGIEEWVHASALTAVYQEKLDRIVLKDNAKIIRTENGHALDSTEGSVITYDLLHATSRVVGERTDGRKTRISAILSPRPKDKTVAPTSENTNPPALRGETKLRNMR